MVQTRRARQRIEMKRRLILSVVMMLQLLLFFLPLVASSSTSSKREREGDASLFSPSKEYTVIGPTKFPKPTEMLAPDARIVMTPTFGKHRPDQDAVFAYAEGYDLQHYLVFVETLLGTGFAGDIVLAVSALTNLQEGVEEYLRQCHTCVIYATDFTCTTSDGASTDRMTDNGGKMSFQMCRLHNIYGIPRNTSSDVGGQQSAGQQLDPQPDPRQGRVVATSRYELYWIWACQYQKHSWIMLIDARDAYFQTNPFDTVIRSSSNIGNENQNSGLLYFYGENTNTTRLGKSPKNRKWLERGYSPGVMGLLQDKPTICSGSTMGEQVALEAYLCAMVNEWDETHIFMKGADQGFHNYLYYSNKLANVDEIRSITVFDQGKGHIHNLGALRDYSLQDLGLFRNNIVYNWDDSVSSVVHQFDRDAKLFHYFGSERIPALMQDWKEKKELKS